MILRRMKLPKEFVKNKKEFKTNSDKKAYHLSHSAKRMEQQKRQNRRRTQTAIRVPGEKRTGKAGKSKVEP